MTEKAGQIFPVSKVSLLSGTIIAVIVRENLEVSRVLVSGNNKFRPRNVTEL